MFYQDWQLSLLAIIMIPIAALSSKNLGKKMGKKVHISLEASDKFMKFLMFNLLFILIIFIILIFLLLH
jgi:subfamily B ATP-binding cassette protein MsbA